VYSLDQVRTFVAVAEERSFRRAAERLRMSQPPLSRQVQKLEREIGVILLDRTKRQVELTPAGAAFLVEARRLLALADTAPDTARLVADGHAGTVRIGFTAASGFDFLGRLITRIEDEAPGLEIVLNELVSSEQLATLERGGLDLALVRPPVGDGFATRVVQIEPLVLAVPAGHDLDVDGPVAPADLAGRTLLLYTRDRARYFADLTATVLAGVPFRAAHQLTQIHTMLGLVVAGRGLALVPAGATALRRGGIRFRPVPNAPDVVLVAAWRRDQPNPALRRILDLLPDACPDPPPATPARSTR
jgi:DNA-binding transcriptional LysR family regulator